MEPWASVVVGVLAAATTILVALLQRSGTKNAKLKDSLNDKKQKFYEGLIKYFANYIDGDLNENEQKKVAKRIRSTNQEIIYYAPSNVIRSYGDLVQHMYQDTQPSISEEEFTIRSKKLFAELEVQIRRDLGHSSRIPFRRESWLDMLRISTTDITTFVSKRNQGDKGTKTKPKLTYEKKEIK